MKHISSYNTRNKTHSS